MGWAKKKNDFVLLFSCVGWIERYQCIITTFTYYLLIITWDYLDNIWILNEYKLFICNYLPNSLAMKTELD